MMVHCVYCYDLFGMEVAQYEVRKGHAAEGEVQYG